MLEDIYMQGQLNEMDDWNMLRHFSEYEETGEQLFFTYQDQNAERLKQLRETFHLEEAAGEGAELKRITRLRNWVYRCLKTDKGNFRTDLRDRNHPWNTFTILDEMQKEPFLADCGTSALVMAEVMLAMGWKAKWVQCLPLDLRFGESHCITHVWSRELKKWIIVDAAQDLFYFNHHAVPFGLPDLREAILNKDRVLIYTNTQKMAGRTWLKQYWVKNIFRFHCFRDSCFSPFDSAEIHHVFLDPKGYVITDKTVNHHGKIQTYTHTRNAWVFWEGVDV